MPENLYPTLKSLFRIFTELSVDEAWVYAFAELKSSFVRDTQKQMTLSWLTSHHSLNIGLPDCEKSSLRSIKIAYCSMGEF